MGHFSAAVAWPTQRPDNEDVAKRGGNPSRLGDFFRAASRQIAGRSRDRPNEATGVVAPVA